MATIPKNPLEQRKITLKIDTMANINLPKIYGIIKNSNPTDYVLFPSLQSWSKLKYEVKTKMAKKPRGNRLLRWKAKKATKSTLNEEAAFSKFMQAPWNLYAWKFLAK